MAGLHWKELDFRAQINSNPCGLAATHRQVEESAKIGFKVCYMLELAGVGLGCAVDGMRLGNLDDTQAIGVE